MDYRTLGGCRRKGFTALSRYDDVWWPRRMKRTPSGLFIARWTQGINFMGHRERV